MKKAWRFGTGIVLICGFLFVCAISEIKEARNSEPPQTGLSYEDIMNQSIQKQNAIFKVQTEVYTDIYGISHIEGVITNNVEDVDYIEVEIPLFDYQGYKVGNGYDSCNGLRYGESWKFDIVSLEDVARIGDVHIIAN